jgi:hypothetical protein
VSDNKENESTATTGDSDAGQDPATAKVEPDAKTSGPTFTKSPDPLAGVKKGASDVMSNMEGKTVSMKLYVGTIIAVVVLMMLARCGG